MDLIKQSGAAFENPMMKDGAEQVGGNHYTKHGDFEPIKVFAHWFTPEELKAWARISAVVYLIRASDKGQDQDVMKAIQTLQKTMDLLKEKE